MKKLFLFCFCGLAAFTAVAQNRITTDTVGMLRAGQDTVVLSDTIRINGEKLPAKKTVWDTLKTELHVIDSLLPKAVEQPQALSVTVDAGRTETILDVSATGGSTYTIPFTLPPGINGVVPQLGLTYNSQGGNGMAGWGWNVYGLSSITRVGAAMYTDDRVGGVNFNMGDRFALDGQRLLLKSGIYGVSSAEYQTEQYSNIKITSWGVSPYGSQYGPEYFEVHHPDGSKAYYGQTTDSRSRDQYAITYMENPQGVRISYTYQTYNNQLYITNVRYGRTGSIPGINQIQFAYATRNRAEQRYIGGESFYINRRISKISVIANGSGYRHYVPTYAAVPTLGYDRMTQFQELDGTETAAFAPINFSYGYTGDYLSKKDVPTSGVSHIASNNSKIVTADFTGDGGIDLLLTLNHVDSVFFYYNIEAGSGQPNWGYGMDAGPYRDIFPITWISHNNTVATGQGILIARDNGINKYKFDVYTSTAITPALYQYSKLWDDPALLPGYYSYCDHQNHPGPPQEFEFISGDFNGDGLSDIMAIRKNISIPSVEHVDPLDCYFVYTQSGSVAYFIDMDQRKTSGYISYLGPIVAYNSSDKLHTADFDGDGKIDFLVVKPGSMTIYSLNDAGTGLILKWTTTDSRVQPGQVNLLGDYNGDGKMDIMFSTGYNNLFATFISTGQGFVKQEQNQPFSNVENSSSGPELKLHVLIPTDINGDGKTDMIYTRTTTYNASSSGSIYSVVHHNTGNNSNAGPLFAVSASINTPAHLRHNPIPVFLNPDKQNPDMEFGFLSDNIITLFRSHKNMQQEALLEMVQHDNLEHEIMYGRLINGAEGYDITPLYEGSLAQTYPYINIVDAPSLRVVKRLTKRVSPSGYGGAQQVFSYKNAVSNAEGLGFVGFGELVRSNWHLGAADTNRTFTIGIQDPQLRGANLRTFTSKSYDINQTIRDMALTNPPPVGGVPDGATLQWDYISRQDVLYHTDTLANRTFVNVPIVTSAKDLLSGTYRNSRMQYDAYYNMTHLSEDINNTGSRRSGMSYANSTFPWSYYIGRLLSRKDTAQTASDIYTTEEQYSYTGNLPTVIKRKGHGTPFVIDSLSYDIFGNMTQRKTTIPDGQQRRESMGHGYNGRFLLFYSDVDTLETWYSYNLNTGDVIGKTDPFGRSTGYQYDSWGRQTAYIDYLNNTTITSYDRTGSSTVITETVAGQWIQTQTLINELGQKTEQRDISVTGDLTATLWKYDVYGRPIQQSVPGSLTQWNTTNYDKYGRVLQEISYTGQVTTYSYNGLTTTVHDGVKSTISTRDALGNTLSVQDPGGTVYYSYYANGNLKETNYGGSIQTIEQDGWGRKTKLSDPSAGVYEYEYDGWGQLTKATTPKGETQYTYGTTGRLTHKSIVGDSTDMQQDYRYDPASKLLIESNLINDDGNHSTYSYYYDAYSRPYWNVEDNIHAIFVKSFEYDSFGRLEREGTSAEYKELSYDHGAGVRYEYQYGHLKKIFGEGFRQALWEADSLNAQGQLTKVLHGNHQFTRFGYDSHGFPQERQVIKSSGTPTTLLTLGTTFNTQRGFPISRSNSVFSWYETFGHDNMDRLTTFNDNNGSHSQSYDARGRITGNTLQGNYSYLGNSYRQDELLLNTPAYLHYQTRTPQQISFNAFKKPVEIHEPGYDRINFQYNGELGRSHMYWGGEQADPLDRRYRRHYAADGSAEMTRDMHTDEIAFVFYLGGDAYSAPAIWKTYAIEDSGHPEGLFFLHRDYLGSIVMITDTAGTVMEQRQFDAWGNIVKLTDGSSNPLTKFVILDRGYTGHEHLFGVELINMNGRLYDARLRRFLSPDNFVQDPYGTQGFNRYGYAMNSPLMYTDPNGEFIIPILVGATVGVLANGITNIIKGDSFFKGWVMAAVMGGIGGYMSVASSISTMTLGQQALGSGIGVASSYLPGVNIPIGDLGSISLSPAFVFGGGGFRFGLSAAISLPWAGDFSIGLGAGLSWGKDGFTGNTGWMSSFTGAIGYNDGTNSFSLSSTQFNAPGLRSQSLGTFSYRHKSGFGIGYSNDGAPFDRFSFADPGSDGFRSAAIQFSYKDFSIGTRIFTGDRDTYMDNKTSVLGYPRGMVGNEDAYSYMSSPLFVGYKGMRAGVDDWRVGHTVQNRLAHDILKPQVWFRWRDYGQNMKLYGGYFSSNNPFILW